MSHQIQGKWYSYSKTARNVKYALETGESHRKPTCSQKNNKGRRECDACEGDCECMSSSLQTQSSSQQASPKLTWLAFEELLDYWKIHKCELIKHWWFSSSFLSFCKWINPTLSIKTNPCKLYRVGLLVWCGTNLMRCATDDILRGRVPASDGADTSLSQTIRLSAVWLQ